MPGWYAGYVLQLEMDENDPLLNLNQIHTNGPGSVVTGAVDVFQSYWFIKSDHLGKVSVGLQSPAGDNAAILVDGSGSLVPSNWVMFDNRSFFFRQNGSIGNGVAWGSLGLCQQGGGIGGDCVSNPFSAVRYDSPVFAGFSVSADWANNAAGAPGLHCITAGVNAGTDCQSGYWDVFGRYAGEWNGIKVAATTGWSETANTPFLASQSNGDRTGYWQSGLYVEHVATGVFVYGAYGREFWQNVNAGFNNEPDHWMVKGGLRERWSSLGHTVLYGSYARRNDMFSDTSVSPLLAFGNVTSANTHATSSELNEWSIGAVQEIDAAAMSLWLQYDHFDASLSGCTASTSTTVCSVGSTGIAAKGLDDFQLVKFGALINF
jgi:hypothetical protein